MVRQILPLLPYNSETQCTVSHIPTMPQRPDPRIHGCRPGPPSTALRLRPQQAPACHTCQHSPLPHSTHSQPMACTDSLLQPLMPPGMSPSHWLVQGLFTAGQPSRHGQWGCTWHLWLPVLRQPRSGTTQPCSRSRRCRARDTLVESCCHLTASANKMPHLPSGLWLQLLGWAPGRWH